MWNKKYCIVSLCACLGLLPGRAQQENRNEDFFGKEVKKTEGILPVYTKNDKVYLEFPQAVWGRELLITAQINKGFDQVDRPAQSVGVVRIRVEEGKNEVRLEQPLYAERFLYEDAEAMPSFRASNYQCHGKKYPVEAVSPEGGLLIDVTDLLATGDEWFSYSAANIRSADDAHAKVDTAYALSNGVNFVVQRRHEYSPDRASVSSAAMMLPSGTLPLEVSCVLRLLPEKDASIRMAGREMPYRSIVFNDYSQDPYRMVTDSLLVRWRMDKPLVMEVDPLFPKKYLKSLRNAVNAWNEAFEKAGINHALKLKMLADKNRPAESDILVAYDLGEPGMQVRNIYHPRTGEILWARLNVGHGFLAGQLEDYWWQEGDRDMRIVKNVRSETVAQELMERSFMRAVGEVLGLKPRKENKLFLKESGKLDEKDIQAIVFGYKVLAKSRDSYEDRDLLYSWMDRNMQKKEKESAPSIKAYAEKLAGLKKQFKRLDEERFDGNIRSMYIKGLRLYGNYMLEVGKMVGSGPKSTQQAAMQLLGDELFKGSSAYRCRTLVEAVISNNRYHVNSSIKEMFTYLLSPETIEKLERADWYDVSGDVYTANDFFNALYASLFNGFGEESYVPEQADWVVLCMEVWNQAVKQTSVNDCQAGKTRLERELVHVRKQLERLSVEHTNESMRHFCALLLGI